MARSRVPRRNAPPTSRSNPSRSRRNARTGVRAVTVAVRGTSISSAISPKYDPRPIVFTSLSSLTMSTWPDDHRIEGSPTSPSRMTVSPGAKLTHSPLLEELPELRGRQVGEAAEAPELGDLLQRGLEVGQRAPCRPAGGRRRPCPPRTPRRSRRRGRSRPGRRRHQPELAEGLAPAEVAHPALVRRSRDPPRPPRGLPCGRRRRRRAGPPGGTPAVRRRDRPQPDPPGDLVQDVLDRDVVEHRERVDQLGGLHPPRRLEPEPDPARRAPRISPADRAQQRDQARGASARR